LDIKYFFNREEINTHHSSKEALRGLILPEGPLLYSWFADAGFLSSVADNEDGYHFTARKMK
jgi:hypothetical protein